MAEKKKTKKQLKEEAESVYVASTLDITYTMPAGLANLLASLSGKPVNEVWCVLSELANVCAVRLSSKSGRSGESWTKKKFPGTQVELRVDMKKRTPWRTKTTEDTKPFYYAKFKINGSTTQEFTQAQVNDYITEKILLGDDEELEEQVAE